MGKSWKCPDSMKEDICIKVKTDKPLPSCNLKLKWSKHSSPYSHDLSWRLEVWQYFRTYIEIYWNQRWCCSQRQFRWLTGDDVKWPLLHLYFGTRGQCSSQSPHKLNSSLQEPQINIYWPQLNIMWPVTTIRATTTTSMTTTITTTTTKTTTKSTAYRSLRKTFIDHN